MTDDLDVALNDLYPAPADDSDAFGRARARVLAAAHDQPVARRRWWPQLSLAAAAAVLAVAVVTVVVGGNTSQVAMVEVAQKLNTAADAQIRARDEPVPAGWYRYISTHSVNTGYGS